MKRIDDYFRGAILTNVSRFVSYSGKMIRCLWIVVLSVWCWRAGWAQASPAKSGYIGSEVCKTCHADVWSGFYKNPHYRSIAGGVEAPEHTGCEGCHGPAQAHVKAGGGRNTIPRAFSLMSPEQALNTCLDCHAADLGKMNIRRSEHTLAQVVCTDCHSIHKSTDLRLLLARKQIDLCYGCH